MDPISFLGKKYRNFFSSSQVWDVTVTKPDKLAEEATEFLENVEM